MEQAKVYFTDFRCHPGLNQQQKLEKLLTTAGMGNIDFEGKIVAIKLHFGELGNLAYLRPNYAKTVADFIKARGGRPFLTDCNTLYVGSRKNALEHMDAAYINGFSPFSTGCHVIIADGLRGGLRRCAQESRHGRRIARGQDGNARTGQALCGNGQLCRLRQVREDLRARCARRHGQKVPDRPRKVRRLRPVYRRLSQGRDHAGLQSGR